MAGSRRYGIASRGKYKGEYTVCNAEDMESCPNHIHGSHTTMTETECFESNERLIAEKNSHASGGLLKRSPTRNHHSRQPRQKMSAIIRTKARRIAAVAAITACLVPALSACGQTADASDAPQYDQQSQSQESNRDTVTKAYGDEIDSAKNKAKDLYSKAKDKAYEYSQSDDWANKKESLRKGGQYLQDQLNEYMSTGSTGGTGNSTTSNVNGFPHQTSNEDALAEMQNVKVSEASNASYDRSSYKHWVSASDAPNWDAAVSCMDVRDAVIATQADNVVLSPDGCSVKSATINDAYGAINKANGTTTFDMKKADVDHIVPLEYVNSHGGSSWSLQQRQNYANDKNNLILVSSTANRQKGSKGPASWMPNGQQADCSYARSWAGVLSSYGISASRADYDAIVNTLQQCQASGI